MTSAHIDDIELMPLIGSRAVLTPAQQKLADELLTGTPAANVCLLRAAPGMGKTTVLRHLHAKLGGTLVTANRRSAAVREIYIDVLRRAMETSNVVFVDDLHLVTEMIQGYDHPRANFRNTAVPVVLAPSEASCHKLVFAVNSGNEPLPRDHRALSWEMDDFEPEDFASICRYYLGESADKLDFDKIHRFSPALNGYQLKDACLWLGLRYAEPDTGSFIEYLRSRNLTSRRHRVPIA